MLKPKQNGDDKGGTMRYVAVFIFGIQLASVAMSAAVDKPAGAAPDGEWRLIGNNPEQQHFSALKQINDATVKRLGLAWYADMPGKDGMVGVPLVAEGVIFQSGPLGTVYANDARTGKLLWSFDSQIQFPMGVEASWGSRLSRGLALWEDKVIKATGDCRLIALERKTGKKVWESQVCDIANHKTITGAPRVGDGKIFIGNSNADSGIGRGHVDAFDASTGRHLWRFYTIPGDPAQGFENKVMEMASKTWGKDYWKKSGGASVWDAITYDPVLKQLYIGTDGASPFDPTKRGEGAGDELFTTSIIALNADTGAYVWHYQTTPGDGWNYGATMHIMIADLPIGNQKRRVVMEAPKNGFFYVLDARTGELVNQPKTLVDVTWASGIDMKTGRPVQVDSAKYWLDRDKSTVISPSSLGAHSWMPMSYSPFTGLVYIPVMDMPTARGEGEGDGFYYALKHKLPFKGVLVAYDPIKQKERWHQDVGRPYQGGALSTAGNLVFQGTTEGTFNAYRADSGKKLWSMPVGSGILRTASTVEIDGEQMIIVPGGPGTTAALAVFKNLAGSPGGPSRLFAFKLDGKAQLPPIPEQPVEVIPQPPLPRPDPKLAASGARVYGSNHCSLCHGGGAVGGIGSIPDLRKATAETHSLFAPIVLGGLRKDKGMPVFAGSINADQLAALQAYILGVAWKDYDAQTAKAVQH